MALSTLFQVLLRALVSIVVQLKWRPALDDAIAMYFPADPASLHSFPPCLLYQQRGILFILPVKKYRLLFIRFITGIFGQGIGTLTVRVYRCGPLYMDACRYLSFCESCRTAKMCADSNQYMQRLLTAPFDLTRIPQDGGHWATSGKQDLSRDLWTIVCLTQVWQSLLPLFCDKTFEFAIQTWQTSLEHYYV